MDIQQQVIKTIAEQMVMNPSEITPETTKETLGMDSLDEVELVMALEEDCDVEIDDAEVEGMKTVGDIVAYIAKRKGVN